MEFLRSGRSWRNGVRVNRIPEKASSKPRHLPSVWLLVVAACFVPALLDVFQTWTQARLTNEPVRWQTLLFQGVQWLCLGAMTPIVYFLGRRYPLGRGVWRRALPIHVAGALTFCTGSVSLGLALATALNRYPSLGSLPQDLAIWFLRGMPWSVFMYFTVLGCIHAFFYFTEIRERELQVTQMKAQLAEARLGALRMQLNPHFLFNSLNALLVLVRDEKAEDAARVLELLGDILRQVLSSDQPDEVPLSDELAFIERYLAVEQIRFSDRLDVHWLVDESARPALVPIFVLQPLVENAIKHGVAKQASAGRIAISASAIEGRLRLSVWNDGAGLDAAVPQEAGGIGLSNSRERLRTMYGNDAAIVLRDGSAGGVDAVLTMPLRARSA